MKDTLLDGRFCYTVRRMGKSYKWWLLAILSATFFFNQADRALFGLLTVPIQDDLGLTDVQIGAINTALFATLAIVTPFAGALGDRFSRKLIVTLSLIGWSLFTLLTGLVGGFVGMMLFRSIAAGAGEACYMPSALPLLARHHRETRSIALSVHQSMLYVGLFVSGALIGALYLLLGSSWRNIFFLFGALGLVLGISFVWILKDGNRDSADGPATRSSGIWESIKAFACCPSALLMTGGATAIVAVNNAYLAWAPKFVMAKYSLSVGDAGTGTMTWHHAFALGAIYLSGLLTDHFAGRWPRFRLGIQMSALAFGAPAIMMFGLAPTPVMAWTAAALYGVAHGFFEANTHASVFDVIESRYRSTACGLMAMCAFLVGSLSPLFLGFMGERSKCEADPSGISGFGLGFVCLGAFYLAGAACMAIAFFKTFRRDRIENG